MSKRIPPVLARLAVLCLCLAFSTLNAFAQSQATTGDIEGRVLDPNGAVVPNAAVTARNEATGFERTANTDGDGNYRIILLPPGTYSVEATANGFNKVGASAVQVTVGSKTSLDLNLAASGVKETVLITAEPPTVETTRTSVATTINERSIQNLPINGRNFQDFATLSPGVIRDPRGGDLSVGGQRGTLNSLQVDGVDNNNTFFGQALGRGGVRPPYQFSEESVQEFQVNQNGFSAEFGRAGGAVINVVTKSGTNAFHGGLFEYLRDESLNANDPVTKANQFRRGQPNKRPPSRINQFGGRVGGPIVKNKAFFFFSYDGQRSDIPQVLDVPNLAAAPAAAQALLLPKLDNYQVGRNQDVFLGKSDISLNQSNQLSLRYNHQGFTGRNNENNGPLSAEEHSGDSLVKSDTFSGSLSSVLTKTVVNEFRFQLARDKEPGEANADTPEAVINTGSGNLNIGRNNFSPRETTIKRFQLIDNVSLVSGRSNYKFGLDFNFDRVLNFFPGLFSGSYTFSNIADPLAPTTTLNGYQAFARNLPVSYTQNFAGASTTGGTTEPNLSEYAFYAQDDVRVTPKLTLNLGARYDYAALACPPVTNPDTLLLNNGINTGNCPRDKNNLAPRAGFSYSPDEKTVFRGGFGLFYARTPAIVLGTAHSQNGINVTGVTLSAAQLATLGLTYPNVLTAPPAVGGASPSLYYFAPDYVQPYVEQGRLGVERELTKGLSLSATYLFYKGVHLTRTRDVNLAAPVAQTFPTQDGTQSFTFLRFPTARPISRASGASYARISVFESAARSLYNGLAFQATQRFTRGFQFIAAYTYSRAHDDRPDQTTVVVGADYARSDTDLRHRFVFSPVYEIGRIKWSDNPFVRTLLSDYTLSGIVQAQSGSPYSALVGNDPNRDGNRANDRLPGTVRNQYTTPSVYQFDARVTRNIHFNETVRLRLILEAFNVFNRANVVTVNNTIYNFTALTINNVPTGRLDPVAFLTAFGTPRTFSSPASGTTTFATPRQLQLAIKFDF